MIVFAIVATIAAAIWSFVVVFANGMRSSPGVFQGNGTIIAAWAIAALLWLAWAVPAGAHDHARPGLDGWYSNLKSGKGPCCDGPGVDALHLSDVDWESRDGGYRVRIDGEWVDAG
jgi:hypothetical protein